MGATAGKATPKIDADIRFIGDLMGCYILASRREEAGAIKVFACRARSITPHGAIVDAPVTGETGEALTVRLDPLGLIRGEIDYPTQSGFAIRFHCTPEEQLRLARRLQWMKRHLQNAAPDRREFKRILPRRARAHLFWPQKGVNDCLIMDMSRSGVAISADVLPPVGTGLAVGKVIGHVVRHIEHGFAIKFVRLQDLDGLEDLLTAEVQQGRPLTADLADRLAAAKPAP